MSLYAITGGAGFIGSHLADSLLAMGHDVRILDDFSTGKVENIDPRVSVLRGDVCDGAAVAGLLEGAAGVFHLAAIASVARGNEDWPGTHRVNVGGSVVVFDAARKAGLPVVYASSAAVYGGTEGVAHEALAPAPLTAYGADKFASELHARVGAHVHGLSSVGLRFFNVFGPRQDPLSPYSGVISIFAGRIAAGEAITVHGDGAQTRDFVFVGDVVLHMTAAMRLAASVPGARVFNVCTGQETSVIGLVQALARLSNRVPVVTHGPARPGDIRRSVGSAARAIEGLGLRAEVSLEDGLRTLLAAA